MAPFCMFAPTCHKRSWCGFSWLISTVHNYRCLVAGVLQHFVWEDCQPRQSLLDLWRIHWRGGCPTSNEGKHPGSWFRCRRVRFISSLTTTADVFTLFHQFYPRPSGDEWDIWLEAIEPPHSSRRYGYSNGRPRFDLCSDHSQLILVA